MNMRTCGPRVQMLPISAVIDRFFQDPFFADAPNGPHGSDTRPGDIALPLDLSEDDKSVIVRASLPGFRREDITVEVHEGLLTIKAQHREEQTQSGERYYRKERRETSMSRRIALPNTVADGGAEATLVDGVLTLRLPKIEKEQPRKIAIN